MKKIITLSVAALLLALSFTPALAYEQTNGNGWYSWKSKDKIVVTNVKQAEILNQVQVVATTGYNTADGGNGGAGGNGGSVSYSDEDNEGGAGGTGGAGGAGGIVVTGDATAIAELLNEVNADLTEINIPCTECDVEFDEIKVHNSDYAALMNGVAVLAETGVNFADGGKAKAAGDGGNVEFSDEDNLGGAGGNSGPGGAGGTVGTGVSSAYANVINRVNYIMTKIQF